MSRKHKYRIRNWKDYNEALVSRGRITFWFDEESIKKWHKTKKTGKRGRPKLYADIAIQCALTIREIFRLPLRGTGRDAVIERHGNCDALSLPRDDIIRSIRLLGRKEWKKQSGYHKRSLAETAMYRLKMIFNENLRVRIFENQSTEAFLRCRALNKMTQLGMPDSYCVK